MSAADPTVVVVGCGVSGLTTALRLRRLGRTVRIVADRPAERTTSAVAGATWFPYKVDPPHRALGWTAASRPVFESLAASSETTGVVLRTCVMLHRSPLGGAPWWADAAPDLALLGRAQLPPGFADGYSFTQAVIDMPMYLAYLLDRFLAHGGELLHARLSSLTEAARYGDVVVNCCGLGARELCDDPATYPVRGQWLRVDNPGIDRVLADFDHPDGDAYIIPHRHSCILGGTADENAWDETPGDEVSARIRRRCTELDPRLAGARALEQRVGLRPVRRGGVRLELDTLADGTPCVHNYGHGGAGVTLSWGCADEVTDLVRSLGTDIDTPPAATGGTS
ncbi:FAD-dependent oxidoreductase [Streptomyces odontomachi]|uniref:FAD-dependent oxidoreductase n=1 Tax=Streptomyces odontomachi TaxID=2944940 RepID=UPI00210D7C33|nr:FAD-dependent oxidoreductase [Streptomyces sp. ODS25]